MNDLTRFDGQSPFDQIKHTRPDGSEYWSARELMPLMGYPAWREFRPAIDRAMLAAQNQGMSLGGLFGVNTEKSGGRPREDFILARFACYLVAMNGDPRKPEVAAAQAYFAIRTHEAETAPKQLTGPELMATALIEAQSMLEAKDNRIAELEPRAEYVETFVADEDLRLFRNVAKSLRISETTLRNVLIVHEWIYREESSRWSNSEQRKVKVYRYSPRSAYARYFTPVPNHEAPRFKGEVHHTLKITPAGAVAIARILPRWGIATSTKEAA